MHRLQELSIGSDLTRVGMISYSDNIIEEFHLDRYTGSDDVISHIRRIQYQGEKANIAQALTVMVSSSINFSHIVGFLFFISTLSTRF